MNDRIFKNSNQLDISHIRVEPVKIEKSFEEEFMGWYQKVLHSAEKIIREWEKSLSKESCCKTGCKHCCYQAVEVYNFELISIIKYIEENNIDFVIDKGISVFNYLEEKLPIITSQYNHLDNDKLEKCKIAYRNLKIPCVFLKEDKCSIYNVRPTCCLNYHCYSSSEECEKFGVMPKGCISLGEVEDWLVNQVEAYFSLNKEKIPRYLDPFEISILPVGFLNKIIYLD